MSQALTLVSDASTLPAALGPDLAAAIDLAKAEKAASTRKAYATYYRLFKAWCDAKGVIARFLLPPRRWRPISPQRPKPRSRQRLAGASRRSATLTSWRASKPQRT